MTQWIDFLQSKNAQLADGQVIQFKDEQGAMASCLSPLTQYGIVCVSGEDAPTFLQNQFCNDVRLVDDSTTQLNAYCSPKGRVLTLFRLFKQGDNFYLLMPKEQIEATIKRLSMFVLMSKVTLTDISEQWTVCGISGENSVRCLETVIPEVPKQSNQCTQIDSKCVINVSNRLFLIIAPVESMIAVWENLSQCALPSGQMVWQGELLRAGIPEIYKQNVEEFVPQMLNLHSLAAISFKKGCYPGQEVVARMHYLGKQKRRMYLAHIDSLDTPPLPGTIIVSANDPEGQSSGKVVNAAPAVEGGVDVLVVMQTKNMESGEISQTQAGNQLHFKDLPYTVELEGKT